MKTIDPVPAVPPAKWVPRRASMVMGAFGALLLLLVVVGIWTHNSVRDGLAEHVAAELGRVLDANVAGLQIWIADEKSDVEVWARHEEVRRLVAELKPAASRDGNVRRALQLAPQQDQLKRSLSSAVVDLDYRGFAVVDGNGLILASDQAERYVGHRVSPAMGLELRRVLKGETVFIRPFPKSALVSGVPVGDLPVIVVASPVLDSHAKVGAILVFTIDPERNFSQILSAARAGDSGDTYAFDDRGFLLSETRHEAELKHLGLVAQGLEGRSVLALQIRDPGGDLTQGFRPSDPPAARPLTRMAATAVTGRSGLDLTGYRDYRGVRVVGAWRWLPEYGFGIATEWEYSEVMQALQPIRVSFWTLFAAVTILGVSLLLSTGWITHLHRRIGAIAQLGQYTLMEKIGEGGMGQVYRARHALLRRPTAIKLIREDAADPVTLARFEREVQVTSELTHPNTIAIFDYGRTDEGIFYYAMEYLPGISLQQLIQLEGPLPPARAVHILSQICASLQEAHSRGLVHRDVNPKNVLLCERGGIYDFAKVLDFGLVKDISHQVRPDANAPQYLQGTPGFVAPERLTTPEAAGIPSDIYSVGAVGFFLLTAAQVFTGASSADICSQAVRSSPPRPSQKGQRAVPDELDELIFACLQKDPAARPASAEEIRVCLERMHFAHDWTEWDAERWWQENAERIKKVQDDGKRELANSLPRQHQRVPVNPRSHPPER